jgi:hypothetical protein
MLIICSPRTAIFTQENCLRVIWHTRAAKDVGVVIRLRIYERRWMRKQIRYFLWHRYEYAMTWVIHIVWLAAII